MDTTGNRLDADLAEILPPLIIAMLLSVAVFSQSDWQWRWLAMVLSLLLGSIPAFLLLVRVTTQRYEQFKDDDEAKEALMLWEAWREASLRAGYCGGMIDAPFVLTARDESESDNGHGAEQVSAGTAPGADMSGTMATGHGRAR
jgi:hypothetical protein